MALYSPRASGLGNSAAYQVAGRPFLTASLVEAETTGTTVYTRKEYKVTFPGVTRKLEVTNFCSGTALAVYFVPREAAGDSGPLRHGQYVVVPPVNDVHGTSSYVAEVKCKELYIVAAPQAHLTGGIGPDVGGGIYAAATISAGSFGVTAEITGIPASDMYQLSGSGINAPTASDGHH